jgi:predicted metal-dependent hydrolase
LNYPNEYILFLVHFHGDRDYFECHEILEEYWKKVAPREKDSHWVGLIQIAVALYHQRRGNMPGAIRTISKAINNLASHTIELQQLGLEVDELLRLLEYTRKRMMNHQPYKSIHLPLRDKQLIQQCIKECRKAGFTWCNDSDPHNLHIIHKHLMRDRSEVIQERERQRIIRIRENRG